MSIDDTNSIGLMQLPELKDPAGAHVHANSSGEDYHLPLANLMSYKGDYSEKIITLTYPTDEFVYNGKVYRIKNPTNLPFTTTGTDAESWGNDSGNFITGNYWGGATNSIDAFNQSGGFEIDGASTIDSWGVAGIVFGGVNKRAEIVLDDEGQMKVAMWSKGSISAKGVMLPNTQPITNNTNTIPDVLAYFPVDGYESKETSYSLVLSADSTGRPIAFIQKNSPSNPYPDKIGNANKEWLQLVSHDEFDVYKTTENNRPSISGPNYLQIAAISFASIPWSTDFKILITGANTSDRYVGSYVIEANLQAPQSTSGVSSYTADQWSRLIKMRFDGPSFSVNNGNTLQTGIFGLVVAFSSNTLNVYLTIPNSISANYTVKLIHKGSSSVNLFPSSTYTTTPPTGSMILPVGMDWNSNNSGMCNDGSLVASDVHMRVINNNTQSSTTRTDILKGGYTWCGSGAVRAYRGVYSVSRTSVGTYTITGGYIDGIQWSCKPPKSPTGEELAIVEISSGSNSTVLTVYSIVYTHDSTTGIVTRGKGELIDIPANSWVDVNLRSTS